MTVSRASIFDGTASSSVRVILLFVVLFLPWLTAHQVSLDAGIVVLGASITTIALVFTLATMWTSFSSSPANKKAETPLVLEDPADAETESTATERSSVHDEAHPKTERPTFSKRTEVHSLEGANNVRTSIDATSGMVTIEIAGETNRIHAASVRDLTLTWGSEAYGFDPHAPDPLDGLDDLVKAAVRAVRRRPLSLQVEAEDVSFSIVVFDRTSPPVAHEELSSAVANYLMAIFARMPK